MFTRTSRAKRRIGAAVLAALIGSLLAFATPANAGPTTAAPAETRLAGANRYATAAAIATDAAWGAAAVDVTIVNGENFPDGLAAAALGKRVLLVKADSIPAETSATIAAWLTTAVPAGPGINSVTIVGGTGVVSSAVYESLKTASGVTPTRVAGADRYATALAVADVVDGAGAPVDVVLATGTNFPDALAAGPLALAESAPIVLNQGASLLPAVKAYLATATGDIHIVGGTGVVPASVASELQSMGKNVIRYGGATREETAVAVATALGTNGDNSAILVNRDGFADALAAGPFASLAAVKGSIMPVGTDSVSTAAAGWHSDNCLVIGTDPADNTTASADAGIYAMGGTGVISEAVLDAAAAAATCPAVTYTAVLTNQASTQTVLELNQTDSGAGAGADPFPNSAGEGLLLTAVPGSVVDGAAASAWTVTVTDAAGAANSAVPSGGNALAVAIDIPAAGLSQAAFASAWNALPQAAALFTASAANLGAPKGFDDGVTFAVTVKTAGTTNQTVTVTYNQLVDDGASVVPADADFTFAAPAVTSATNTPLDGTASVAGATVFTHTFSTAVAANVLVAGTSTVTIADVLSVATNLPGPTTATKITAG